MILIHKKDFLIFFQDLNKSMFFKLSTNYENATEKFGTQINVEIGGATWKDKQHLKKIYLKTVVYPCFKHEKVQKLKKLSSKIKNQDFYDVIQHWIELQGEDLIDLV